MNPGEHIDQQDYPVFTYTHTSYGDEVLFFLTVFTLN